MSALQHPEGFVRWFRQAAPYVHAFRGRVFVIGFGGELVAERTRLVSFVHDLNLLAALGIRLVLVPGARPQIEAELSRNQKLAGKLGATGTPLFVVGDKVMNGAVGYDTLKQAIAEARARA